MKQVIKFLEKSRVREENLNVLAYPAIGQIKRQGKETPIASLDYLAQIFNAVPEGQRDAEFRRVHRSAVNIMLRELNK